MYVEFNLATRIESCWWPEVSGRLPAGLLKDARIHSQTQIFKTQNIFPSSFGSGLIAKETNAANSAFLFLHWRKHKAKPVSNKGGTRHGNTRRPQMPRIWHLAEEAHGPSQHPPPGTARGCGDGQRWEQEAEPPISVCSPPPVLLALGGAKDHCSGTAALVPQLTSRTELFLCTKTKSLQRHNCRGIKIFCLIMSGSGYQLHLQHFPSALLAKHWVSRGDFTTCAIVSSSRVLQADRAVSHPRHKHTNYNEGFTYLGPGLPATLSPSLSRTGNTEVNSPATHSHWLTPGAPRVPGMPTAHSCPHVAAACGLGQDQGRT